MAINMNNWASEEELKDGYVDLDDIELIKGRRSGESPETVPGRRNSR